MTVLKQHHAPGMPADVYDQVAAGAMPSQSKADGFAAHYAIVEDGGITVIEIWDSIAQHDAWFNEVVKPHLPPDTPEPVSVVATGDLTIHGVTKSVQLRLGAQLVNGTIVIVGSVDITFADYGVTVPKSQIVLSVDDHGTLEMQLLLTKTQ